VSLTGTRDQLVVALSEIEDLTAFGDTFPDSPQTGDVLVSWASLAAQGAPGLFETVWELRVVGGGTPSDSLAFLDDHLSDILEAMDGLLIVTDVRPVAFGADTGNAYGVLITGNRE
jgi:hypothetical protein